MKLQQLLQEDAVIYCSIEAEMIEVLEIAKNQDYKVSKKYVYFAENLINSSVQKEVCIRLKTMTSGRVDTYKKNGHTVVSAIDFILANSDTETNIEKAKRLYCKDIEFVSVKSGLVCKSRALFFEDINEDIYCTGWLVFKKNKNKWAEIIPQKEHIQLKPMKIGKPGAGGFDPNNPAPDELNISEPVFENGEEVEIDPNGDDNWCVVKYIGMDGDNYVFWSEDDISYWNIELNQIRKIKPVKQPEIGALCLFNSFESRINNGKGTVSVLKSISKQTKRFGTEHDTYYDFCRQIESINFKD